MTYKDVFILGAGFSKAINPLMPTMADLTNAVRNNPTIKLPPPLKDVEGDGTSEIENNVEAWLSYLFHRQPWLHCKFNVSNKEVANQIFKCISDFIDLRTRCSVKSPAPEWLNTLVKLWNERRASVITLNYDTLVERVAKGMGMELDQMYLHPCDAKTFTYLKMHGSINWYKQRQGVKEPITFSDVPPWGAAQDSISQDSDSNYETQNPLIIPPLLEKTTYFDEESIRSLWLQAADDLYEAKRVFVIGYSLPMSDLSMQFFIKKNSPIKSGDGYKSNWYIVDTNYGVIDRYRDLLEPHQTVKDDFVCAYAPVHKFVTEYPNLP